MSILIIGNTDFYKAAGKPIGVGKEFKNEQQFLWQFRTGTNLDAQNKISLVIYNDWIIYNKWDSEYELTYGTFYNWLQQNEINGYDSLYFIHNPLCEYLIKKCKKIQPSNNRSSSIDDIIKKLDENRLKICSESGTHEYMDPDHFVRSFQWLLKTLLEEEPVLSNVIMLDMVKNEKVTLVELDGKVLFNNSIDGSLTMEELYNYFRRTNNKNCETNTARKCEKKLFMTRTR